MRVTALIPARYASSRFPGKPLAEIAGKPMIQWVYERTSRSALVDRVIVATDDERIRQAVQAFGGEVQMTRSDHPTGTDRLAEVAARIETDIVVNVQGDEPLIDPRMIDMAVEPLTTDPSIPMGTLKTPIASVEEFLNPNVVKVVTDREGFALYFSRAPIPHPRDFADGLQEQFQELQACKHIGLYVYRRDFLLAYPGLPVTPLENLEKLEQLRALEHGHKIRVVETSLSSLGVDTPEDLEKVREYLKINRI
ncbi:3-deoxy-manno-octulosonate cytidylyltransferase [Desulfuromonas versatilis]|uniref:3-deoxy-manno-octulosonate cytidylyltransferase n=1 Tax=Desulfuromonas versatilis TaxID=2802975 RepID=A0ABM8HR13_9BACT|nr:3-deoxy-manno-octulosonate cytidylyltransferase [Desulfuromonas versatilis]BCR05496.1 3-deoxy-manno-octulosonate cytidylyltransferase [Desulfuromonas versatilis]